MNIIKIGKLYLNADLMTSVEDDFDYSGKVCLRVALYTDNIYLYGDDRTALLRWLDSVTVVDAIEQAKTRILQSILAADAEQAEQIVGNHIEDVDTWDNGTTLITLRTTREDWPEVFARLEAEYPGIAMCKVVQS